MSLMTSFLYCGSIPITSPLEGRPTPALGADMPCFTSVLRVSLFVFFPYFGVFLLPSFSNVFGLIIKITVVCKINAKVYQVFCFCGVRMETDNEVEVWHAMRATYRRELDAVHLLEKENLGCFVPMPYNPFLWRLFFVIQCVESFSLIT